MASVDDQEYSDVVRLGELEPLVINRFVALAAATVLVDPRDRDRTKWYVDEFLSWLDDGIDDRAERELRRSVLLTVTRGLQQHGVSAKDGPADVVKLVEETFNRLA